MPRIANRLFFAIWLCFAIRLLFYAAVYPLWEGLDEWAHLAYVDHLREHASAPTPETPVSGEIAASLRLLPLAPHLPPTVGTGLSHKAYWRLPAEERARRQDAVHALRLGQPPQPEIVAKNYQAQHPPIAYRLMQLADAALGFVSLPDRVFALRFLLVLLVSLTMPLLWMLCHRVFATPALALPSCLVLALLPNFAVYVARLSNDALAMVLLAASLVAMAGYSSGRLSLLSPVFCAVIVSLTALTKAYGILLVPVFALVCLWPQPGAPSLATRFRHFAVFLGTFLAIAGWWYLPVFLGTGTLSGEALDVQAAAIPLSQRLPNLLKVDWWRVWMLGSESFIWISGWSFLLLDDWLCWVFRAIGLAALVGLLRAAVRGWKGRAERRSVTVPAFWLVPLPLAALFVFAIAYQGWQIFNAFGDSTAVGWYLTSASTAGIVVLLAGLAHLFGARVAPNIAAALALVVAALDLFTLHFVSLPYYAGLHATMPPARMPVLSASIWPSGGLPEIAERLAVNHPSWLSGEVLLGMWLFYLPAFGFLVALALRLLLARPPADGASASSAMLRQ
jgi:hypothetical protein